jgi:hypothetical protein
MEKTVDASGKTVYTLPGGQGTMTLPPGWDAAKEGEKFQRGFGGYGSAVTPGAIPERGYNIRLPGGGTTAIPSGRTLAEKEQAEGIVQPKEFDYNEFQTILKQIGGDQVPINLRTRIFETMLKGVDEHNQRIADLKKLQAQVGTGSPAMISAQAQAKQAEFANQISAAKAPAEIQKLMTETLKTQAETGAIPAQAAEDNAMAAYYQAITTKPEYQHLKDIADTYMKAYQNELDPDKRNQLLGAAIDVFSKGMATTNRLSELQRRHPNWNLPTQPQVGQTYEVTPGIKVQWDGQRFTGAK